MRKLLLIIIISLTILAFVFFLFKIITKSTAINDTNSVQPINQIPQDKLPEEELPNPPQIITISEKPAKEGAKYFEKVVKVQSEFVYLAYPLSYEKDNPPRLIVYSHGSNTTVSKDFSDPFMKDMQMYGEYFTKRGYAFSASSLHGANWGSNQSIQDIVDQIDYISGKYSVKEKINLLGFRMGGLAVFNFAFENAHKIESIALLAPTSRTYSEAQFKQIRRIPIYIWHGNKDVNVPYSLSTALLLRAKDFGFTNIKLNTIDNTGHFDIDTELRKDILNFYNANE